MAQNNPLFSITTEEAQEIARKYLERELSREELQAVADKLRNEYEKRGIAPEDLVIAVIEVGIRDRV